MEAPFDTFAYARRLREAGVSETQAGAHTEALRAAFAEGVVTKADLRAETARLEARIVGVEARIIGVEAKVGGLEAKVDSLDAKIGVLQWALGFIALLTLAMAARLFGVV